MTDHQKTCDLNKLQGEAVNFAIYLRPHSPGSFFGALLGLKHILHDSENECFPITFFIFNN